MGLHILELYHPWVRWLSRDGVASYTVSAISKRGIMFIQLFHPNF